jgi:F-type H+-transporting ATPase subunit a
MAADPLLHIKDSYYFEVPKFLWPRNFMSIDDVPWELRRLYKPYGDLEPESLDVFNAELSGKIIIPQPFGTLRNLYEKESGFCISRFMIIELIVGVLLVAVFTFVARKARGGGAPGGRFWNLFEAFLVYLRDQVARPAIGGHGGGHSGGHNGGGHHEHPPKSGDDHHGPDHHGPDHHAHRPAHAHSHNPYEEADRFVPLLWTIFFFILFCNLMGLVPWVGAPTSGWGATLALACVTFLTVLGAGMIKFGPLRFWLNQIPQIELPVRFKPLAILVHVALLVLRLFIFAIEVIGMLIRHVVLSIRLLMNMVAGHLVLLGILGLAIVAGQAMNAAQMSGGLFATVSTISVLGTTALTFLELFVALLQAYVFTFLSALFIGAAVHHH